MDILELSRNRRFSLESCLMSPFGYQLLDVSYLNDPKVYSRVLVIQDYINIL